MTARLDPPQHFDDERRAIWAETVTRLTSSGRVFRADPEVFGTYVEAVRSHRQASRLLAQTNVMVTRDGKAMENPALAIQRKSAEAMARASRSLGLDRIPSGPLEEPLPPAPAAPAGGGNGMARTSWPAEHATGKAATAAPSPAALRDAEAASLRAKGRTFDQIAAELNFPIRSKGRTQGGAARLRGHPLRGRRGGAAARPGADRPADRALLGVMRTRASHRLPGPHRRQARRLANGTR